MANIHFEGTIEEFDEFVKRYKPKEPITLQVDVPAKPIEKSVKKSVKKATKNGKNNIVEFPPSIQKEYELKWAMEKYNEDWWDLRYKNGVGYKRFEHNLIQLCFLRTFKGKITEKELTKYAKQFNMSENKLRKIIWNLKEGVFDNYFNIVENEVKKIKVNVLRNNNIIINNIETEMGVIETKGLLFSIQNAPNKPRTILKQYKQFEHKIDMKNYFLLCWNYSNPDILDKIRFGGI